MLCHCLEFAKWLRSQGTRPSIQTQTRIPTNLSQDGGLGIHLTLDLSGAARFGPDVEWVDKVDYAVSTSRHAAILYGSYRVLVYRFHSTVLIR
jgi:hypothetical protein